MEVPEVVRSIWADPKTLICQQAGTPGYSIPSLDGMTAWALHKKDALPEGLFVHLHSADATGWLVAPPGFRPTNHMHVHLLGGARDCAIVIGPGARYGGHIFFHAARGLVSIAGEMHQFSPVNMRLWSDWQVVLWGKRSTSNGTTITSHGQRQRVVVGDDCMFADQISIRPADIHAMVSMETGALLNPPADILIEPRVWLCERAMILKGTRVGFGSIIGAQSVVTRDIPRFSLAVGQPARVQRSNVAWSRYSSPEPGLVERLRESEALLDPWPIS